MPGARFRFGDFTLDPQAHRLVRGGADVALSPRCFDLLHLFVRHPGDLLTKDRLFADVWDGVIVGDEALTQAIKDLRKALGDDASAPTFIETVPRRGYRFVAPVEGAVAPNGRARRRELVLAGTAGGAIAGLIGGLAYGLVAGMGNPSALAILIVMTLVTALIAALGAFGLSLGMAVASRLAGRPWLFSVLGASLGGFIVGDLFHLALAGGFPLFLGLRHDAFTGGLEGLVLGGAIAAGAALGGGVSGRWPRPVVGAGLGGALAGMVLSLLGGRLMAASLAGLARRFHGSALDLGLFGRLAGEGGFPPLVQALVAGGEGLLLGTCLVASILHWDRRSTP